MKLRAPCVPLITIDPYFSVWSSDCALNASNTEHWTGKSNNIIGTADVDGEKFLFLGYHRDIHKMTQISLDIDALSTTAVFENGKIRLKAVFTSPVIADDYTLLTRPVSYLELSWESIDGKEHNVHINIAANEELCLDEADQSPVETEKVSAGKTVGMKMGNTVQKPLNRSGDDVRIDWGYFYLMTDAENAEAFSAKVWSDDHVHVGAELKEGKRMMYYFAYDDIVSIEYFGKHLKSYWNKDGKTILEAIAEAAEEYDEIKIRCKGFAEKLYADAFEAGGEKYAELLSLAYRQVIAAHKLVLDENGEILFISKECFSNGCAATVDVSYPSIPMFLLYNPELVKGMMRPVIRYAKSDAWIFDFAPHDVGQYPLVNGQVYGENALKYQMPVEECGNMLVMDANVAIATGSADFAAEHLDLLEKWCSYLIEYGADPGNQLCTDDFAGHLAHNCNLSLKAVMDKSNAAPAAADQSDEQPVPSDEYLKSKWPELAQKYSDKPRLASMLSSSTLVIEEADDAKVVTFRVVNEAQKDWVESKLLYDLEGNYRKIVGSTKISLRVAVVPDDAVAEKKAYMPSEQAGVVMSENAEVKNLITDLGLDIK